MNLKNNIIKNHVRIAQVITFIIIGLIMTFTNVSSYYAAHYIKFGLAFGVLTTTIHMMVLTVRHWLMQKDTV
jgi:uncharacterized membrane protein